MNPPFSDQQFLAVFADYNQSLWLAAALLWLATAGILWRAVRHSHSSVTVSALLAVHWLWSGGAYHLLFFTRINPAARLFGSLFILQGLLFLWFGVMRAQLQFHWGAASRPVLSIALGIYSLLYPALVLLAGLRWPAMPAFAVPCPTAILTVGMLLALEPATKRWLSVIPVLWTVLGGPAALLFGVTPDLVLPVAGAVLLAYDVAPRLPVWRAA
jgi:Family of unknown function (DUF6064)